MCHVLLSSSSYFILVRARLSGPISLLIVEMRELERRRHLLKATRRATEPECKPGRQTTESDRPYSVSWAQRIVSGTPFPISWEYRATEGPGLRVTRAGLYLVRQLAMIQKHTNRGVGLHELKVLYFLPFVRHFTYLPLCYSTNSVLFQQCHPSAPNSHTFVKITVPPPSRQNHHWPSPPPGCILFYFYH